MNPGEFLTAQEAFNEYGPYDDRFYTSQGLDPNQQREAINKLNSYRKSVQSETETIEQLQKEQEEIANSFYKTQTEAKEIIKETEEKLYDNLGREIDPDKAEFLKNTKIVDSEKEQVLTLFHKSDSVFDKFDKEKLGKNSSGMSATGAYFKTDNTYVGVNSDGYMTQWYSNAERIFEPEKGFTEKEIDTIIDEFYYGLENKEKKEVKELLSKNDISTLLEKKYNGHIITGKENYYKLYNNPETRGFATEHLTAFREEKDFYDAVLNKLDYQAINKGDTVVILDTDTLIRANDEIKNSKELNDLINNNRPENERITLKHQEESNHIDDIIPNNIEDDVTEEIAKNERRLTTREIGESAKKSLNTKKLGIGLAIAGGALLLGGLSHKKKQNKQEKENNKPRPYRQGYGNMSYNQDLAYANGITNFSTGHSTYSL